MEPKIAKRPTILNVDVLSCVLATLSNFLVFLNFALTYEGLVYVRDRVSGMLESLCEGEFMRIVSTFPSLVQSWMY